MRSGLHGGAVSLISCPDLLRRSAALCLTRGCTMRLSPLVLRQEAQHEATAIDSTGGRPTGAALVTGHGSSPAGAAGGEHRLCYGRNSRSIPLRGDKTMRILYLAPLVLLMAAFSSCGGNEASKADEPQGNDPAPAWATVGKEVVGEMQVAFLTGDISSCFECDILGDRNPDSDIFGLEARALLEIICPLGHDQLASKPEAARNFARGCDSIGPVLDLDIGKDPMPASAARTLFDRADEAFVAAGASAEGISDTARRGVLLVVLSKLFEPYLEGTAKEGDSPSTRQALRYLCPSMLSDGDASIEACRGLSEQLSYVAADGSLDYAKPAAVKPTMESMLAALAPP